LTEILLRNAPASLTDCPDGGSDPNPANGPAAGYHAYHAQSENGTALIEPPLSDSELFLKRNLAIQNQSETPGHHLATDFWGDLRQHARVQLLADARRYTTAYRDIASRVDAAPRFNAAPRVDASDQRDSSSVPIVMAGHQPTLFHPGVWFKNDALQQIAGDTGAHAINLVIDNDVAASRAVRVPVRDSIGRVRYRSIHYDVGGAGVPFEQAKIRDLRQFDRFDEEVRQAIAPIVADPCVTRLWPHARAAIRRCEIAGCALAQARHSLEGELGWQTLEIPLGVAVRGLPFARFVMEMIDDAERFHRVYNGAADHYRAWHGIRSTAHPVPNLARDEGWLELPLWVYGNDLPVRRAVWVRRIGNEIELSDRRVSETNSPGSCSIVLPGDNRDAAASMLAEVASPEFKLRPRALMTTMFARLLLSDLFLHGIGGGKYDQLADRIICQFFHLTPPAFQVVSATVRLPGQDRDAERAGGLAKLQRQIRETRYHGENWIDLEHNENASLVQRKRELIGQMPPHGQRQSWHDEIEKINLLLAQQLQSERQKMQTDLQRLRLAAAEEQVLASRELSFCLFPLDELVGSFGQMLR